MITYVDILSKQTFSSVCIWKYHWLIIFRLTVIQYRKHVGDSGEDGPVWRSWRYVSAVSASVKCLRKFPVDPERQLSHGSH